MEKFICIKDLQGGEFAVGCAMTIEEWRERAMFWADSDSNEELFKSVKNLPKKYIIDFIQDIWDLEIISVNDLDIESMFEIVNDIDYINHRLEELKQNANETTKEVLEDILYKTEKIMKNNYREEN